MEAAKQSRTAAKAWITRLGNQLSSACDSCEHFRDIQDRLSGFKEKVEKLNSAQETVESLIDPASLESDIDIALEYYDQRIRPVIRKAEAYLEKKVPAKDDDSSSLSSERFCGHEAQLPKITLPEFCGDPCEWPSWWDLFEANIHETEKPAVVKFSYLKSLLKDSAMTVISGLKLTAANYPVAVSLLNKRYGRPDRIIFQHVESLLNLKVVPDPSVAQLYTLLDSLQSHIRSLETMGITGSQYGVILTPLILSRLPANLRLQWVRESEREEASSAGTRVVSPVPDAPGRLVQGPSLRLRRMPTSPNRRLVPISRSSSTSLSGRSGVERCRRSTSACEVGNSTRLQLQRLSFTALRVARSSPLGVGCAPRSTPPRSVLHSPS